MAHIPYTDEEVARLGQQIYERNIRKRVEQKCRGQFLVIDVESGDYEIDIDKIAAIDRLRSKHPEAILYVLKIGYSTAAKLGHVKRES